MRQWYAAGRVMRDALLAVEEDWLSQVGLKLVSHYHRCQAR